MFDDSPIVAIILWVFLLGCFGYVMILKIIGKRKYKGVDMPIDYNWFENSNAQYPNDLSVHQYYFHPDKHFSAQGHLMEDRNHQIVYEAKFLYNNAFGKDEVDFVNHINNYNSHHQIGHTLSSSIGSEGFGASIDSTFSFDGQDVYQYLTSKGYSYHFNIHGLAYSVDILYNGIQIGKLYSSNNGKNFFEADGSITPKMGGTGFVVVESTYQHLDAVFLYAIVFARTEFSSRNLKA